MSTIKVALAGAGAFGVKHLEAIEKIDGVEAISLVSRELDKTRQVAERFGIRHVATDLGQSLALTEVDAVILCTPTQMHAAQALACLAAGKHVQVEIPLADSQKDAEDVVAKYNLNPQQREAVRNLNVLELIAAGGNAYFLAKLGGIFGLDMQDIGAQQTGMTKEAFKAKLAASGRR